MILAAFCFTSARSRRCNPASTMEPRREKQSPFRSVNPMQWDGWIETDRAWLALNVDLTREFDPEPAWHVLETRFDSDARCSPADSGIYSVVSVRQDTLLARPAGRTAEGAERIELIDLRFRRNDRQGFTATAVFDASGRLLRSGFHF